MKKPVVFLLMIIIPTVFLFAQQTAESLRFEPSQQTDLSECLRRMNGSHETSAFNLNLFPAKELFRQINKSGDEAIFLRDSILSYHPDEITQEPRLTSKSYMYYDENGRVSEIIYNKLSANGVWSLDGRYVPEYEGDLLMRFSYYHWSAMYNMFRKHYKREYIYDEQGNITQSTSYEGSNNPPDTWVYRDRWEMSYDANGNRTEEKYAIYFTIETTQEWIYLDRYNYTYDVKNCLREIINYRIDFEEQIWNLNYKFATDYNVNLLPKQTFTYKWDTLSNTWRTQGKSVISYDDQWRKVLSIDSHWNASENSWENTSKVEYTYLAGNQPYESISFRYDSGLNNWIPIRKTLTERNEMEQILLSIESNWIIDTLTGNGSWNNRIKNENDYDEFGNTLYTSQRTWDTTEETWNLDWFSTQHYSQHILIGIDTPVLMSKVIVYPNPASETLFIKGLENNSLTQLYTLNGTLLKEARVTDQLYISELPNGIYLLRLQNGISFRIVKK